MFPVADIATATGFVAAARGRAPSPAGICASVGVHEHEVATMSLPGCITVRVLKTPTPVPTIVVVVLMLLLPARLLLLLGAANVCVVISSPVPIRCSAAKLTCCCPATNPLNPVVVVSGMVWGGCEQM